jgi:hypothetical protein
MQGKTLACLAADRQLPSETFTGRLPRPAPPRHVGSIALDQELDLLPRIEHAGVEGVRRSCDFESM